MEIGFVLYEKQGKIATITLNRPEKLNVMSAQVHRDIISAFNKAETDKDVSVVILKGAGRAFSAGHDYLSTPEGTGFPIKELGNYDRYTIQKMIEEVYLHIWNFPKPTIAQVHGYCIAGSFFLASNCDIIVVAEDTKISFEPLGTKTPGGYIEGLLAYQIGARKARELAFLSPMIDGKEAVKIGWANRSVPLNQLEREVQTIAEQISQTPVEYLGLAKASINASQEILGMRQMWLAGIPLRAIIHMHPDYMKQADKWVKSRKKK